MERLYTQLKASGFQDVKILDGGIDAWRHAGLPLEGTDIHSKPDHRITPQQFFPERQYADWVVVEFEQPPASSEEIKTQLKSKLSESKVKTPRVLIVTDNGVGYEKIEPVVDQMNIPLVYYLAGGRQSYKAYLDQQTAIQNRSPEKWGSLRSCGRRLRWNEQKG